ncbi:hypothetical protein FHR90_000974 [Endobacter medicaginis]|uniref:Uncharacterized protein n=1 Tax=Endobacter medicaginis TaxID=1181271 RepID=A0A850NU80_9PROT|nr:hypothetical protein [Endobacter medicaginis]MBB3173156.1 hypothetical protein [Endobacter medicaginis]MCX5476098.1 hypothetical protein [Endobacter medicaginis]NVN32454.1 hypothetical protein [Endobacter medicaginis]
MLETSAPLPVISPLMLTDQLLTMAQAADRAGMRRQARSLVRLALDVCGNVPAGKPN